MHSFLYANIVPCIIYAKHLTSVSRNYSADTITSERDRILIIKCPRNFLIYQIMQIILLSMHDTEAEIDFMQKAM